jgi:hypothetical protein
MTAPAHIVDTARHLAEWERRKTAFIDFVAEFADGQQITVGVSCTADKLEPAHGLFWARFAHPDAKRRAVLPKVVRARFEQNGKMLAAYDEASLAVIDETCRGAR